MNNQIILSKVAKIALKIVFKLKLFPYKIRAHIHAVRTGSWILRGKGLQWWALQVLQSSHLDELTQIESSATATMASTHAVSGTDSPGPSKCVVMSISFQEKYYTNK